MDAEKDVNNKIKELLDYTKEYKQHDENAHVKSSTDALGECAHGKTGEGYQGAGNVQKLIEVLKRNEELYSKIHMYLSSSEHDKLQNELLRENINSSLVCESMMKVLREISTERNESVQNEKNARTRMNELLKEQFDQKRKIMKLMDDLKYCSSANNELLRLVQDQKGRIGAYKEKYELERKNVQNMKVINEELDSLRRKALTKIEVLTKETSVLSDRIKECNSQIAALKQYDQQKEETEKSFESQMLEMERSLNEHKKILEEKGKALEMCNSELAKLLAMEKRMKEEIKNLNEKSCYYERLYKSINEQNEYLNAQLTKFINNSEIVALERSDESFHSFGTGEKGKMTEVQKEGKEHDETAAKKQFHDRLHKYRKRLKKYKKLFNVQNDQIAALKGNLSNADEQFHKLQSEFLDLRRFNDGNISKRKNVAEELLSKMKELMDKNLEYQSKIIQLESKKMKKKTEDKWSGIGKRYEDPVDRESINNRNDRDSHEDWIVNNEPKTRDNYKFEDIVEDEFKDFTESTQQTAKHVMREPFNNVVEDTQHTVKPVMRESFKDEWTRFFEEAERQRNMRIEDDAHKKSQKTVFYDAKDEVDKSTIYAKNKNAVENIWDKITTTFKPSTRANAVELADKMDKLSMSTKEKRQDEFFDVPSQNEAMTDGENAIGESKNGKLNDAAGKGHNSEEKFNLLDAMNTTKNVKHQMYDDRKTSVPPVLEKEKRVASQIEPTNNVISARRSSTSKTSKNDPGYETGLDIGLSTNKNKDTSTDSDSTTDTFRRMREKTQKLQQKFSELEQKLSKIKGNNDPSSKKLHDQIEAYTNYYYTDFVDISNDSDFI